MIKNCGAVPAPPPLFSTDDQFCTAVGRTGSTSSAMRHHLHRCPPTEASGHSKQSCEIRHRGAQLIRELVTFELALEERRRWCPAAAAAAPSAPVEVMQQRRGGRRAVGACFSLLLLIFCSLLRFGSDIVMRFVPLCSIMMCPKMWVL